MSSYLKSAALAAVVGAAVSTPALAQDAAGVEVTGFVDSYYTYNFNDPQDRLNGLHVFNPDHNALSLSLAEIAFEKKPTTDSRAGFRVDLNFGPAAELTNFFDPSKENTPSLGLLQQGYVSFLAGDKIQVDFGKFVTPIGNELVESKDNWNYTRSIQFGWAIPFYHAGARATLTASDKFTLAAYLVNGWNNVVDNNNDKTFIAQAILKPSDKFTLVGNAIVGKEAVDTRTLFDAVLVFNLSDKLALASEIDFGSEGDLNWSAYSAYARLSTGSLAFTLRGEVMDDEDGWAGIGTTVSSGTLTTEFKLGGGVVAKLDLRTDTSDSPIFSKDNGALKDSQSSVTLGLVYAFGGKI